MNHQSSSTTVEGAYETSVENPSLWEESLERKKEDVSRLLVLLERKRQRGKVSSVHVVTLDEAIKLKDKSLFHSAVQEIATKFATKNVSKVFKQYLYPHLDHFRQFSKGVASAVQCDPTGVGSLVFGLLFIVIQCGCIFSESIETTLKQLDILQQQLPSFQEDQSMFPTNDLLKSTLQDIFCIYIDFCVTIVRNMIKKSLVVVVRNFFSPSFQQELNRLSTEISRHVAVFDRTVQQCERGRSAKADDTTHELLKDLQDTSLASKQPKFPVRSVNIAENKSFVGRADELREMFKLLIEDHQEARPVSCVLHGIGGVGKTQTALKFLYQFDKEFDAIFWVSADPEKETETQRTFGNIGVQLKLFDDKEDITEAEINQVTQWFNTTDKKWLLVFDNVVKRRDLGPYWPTHCQKSSVILVTSQAQIGGVDYKIPIRPLDDQQGATFLLNQLDVDEASCDPALREAAGKISHVLGGSPLWLKSAQGILEFGCTFQECLEQLQTDVDFPGGTRSAETGREQDSHTQYERAAIAAHDYLLKQLPPGSLDILFMVALMNPDDVSEELLLRPPNHTKDELEFLHRKSSYLLNVAELSYGNLIQRDTTNSDRPYLRTHRAVQRILILKLSKDDYASQRQAAFARVVRVLRDFFPPPSKTQIAQADVRPRLLKVLPHLLTLLHAFEALSPAMKGDLALVELLCDVAGMDLFDQGSLNEAYWINKIAERILDSLDTSGRDLGAPDTPDAPILTGEALKMASLRSDALTIAGLSTDFMGLTKRQEGLEMRQKCKEIRRLCFRSIPESEVTADDKIRLYNSYGDLATSFQQLNDFKGVRENMEECLKNYKLWGDEKAIPYEYAKYYSMTSFALIYENDYTTAVDYAERAYKLIEEAYPGTSSAILHKSDYALILFQTGPEGRQEAHLIMKDLLSRSEKDCGEDNLRTLELRMIFGIMLYFVENYTEARVQIEKALQTGETKIQQWPVENAVRGRYYLSQIRKKINPQDAEAERMEQEAKARLEELLKLDFTGKAAEYRGDYPMLFDYLVNWECRLVTPRQPSTTEPQCGP